MILAWVLWEYRKDCKEIGKENLAVPLGERLLAYFVLVGLPVIAVVVKFCLGGAN